MLQVWEKVCDGEAGQGGRVLAGETQQVLHLLLLSILTQAFGGENSQPGAMPDGFHIPPPPSPALPLERFFTRKNSVVSALWGGKGDPVGTRLITATWPLWGATSGRDFP